MLTVITTAYLCLLVSTILVVIRKWVKVVGLDHMDSVTTSSFGSCGLNFHNYQCQLVRSGRNQVIPSMILIVILIISHSMWYHEKSSISWDCNMTSPILQKRRLNHYFKLTRIRKGHAGCVWGGGVGGSSKFIFLIMFCLD